MMGAHTVSRSPPPQDAHLGIHQMVQGCSPVLKREEELAQTITVTLTGLNSSRTSFTPSSSSCACLGWDIKPVHPCDKER